MASDVVNRVLKIVHEISGNAVALTDEQLLSTDYLDNGLVDSLQIVELITRLETEFSIRFSHQDLESERFRALKGVAEIITGILAAKLEAK